MNAARRPTRAQVRRRRGIAAGVVGLVLVAVAWLLLAGTIFGPSNAEIAKPLAGPRGKRGLLVYLHGRGGYEGPSTTRSCVACRSFTGTGR
jgi:hypothetical protein